MDDLEWISPDDYGALTRSDHAVAAAEDHRGYLMRRLLDKYRIGPGDAIETDGRITRAKAPTLQ